MITGDNPLTACHVAKELRFTQKSGGILVLTTDESKDWFWESIDQTLKLPLVADKSYKELVQKYDLTLTGEVSAVEDVNSFLLAKSITSDIRDQQHYIFLLLL